MECGCSVTRDNEAYDDQIEYCRQHKAAPLLLDALESNLGNLELDALNERELLPLLRQTRKAIRAAGGNVNVA
jgi:hypothetical protein